VAEDRGCLARWTSTGGQTDDATQAEGGLDRVATRDLIADKAYAASWIDIITQTGARAVIPRVRFRKNRVLLIRINTNIGNCSNASSVASNSFVGWQTVTINWPAASQRSSQSWLLSSRWLECQQPLVKRGR
jgi:hypothetical protein